MENLSSEKNTQNTPDDETIEALFAKAVRHHGYGELSKAESLYQRILAREANHIATMKKYGVLAFQFGDYELAEQLLEEAYTLVPFDLQLAVNLVMCKMKLDKSIEALPVIKVILKHNPDSKIANDLCEIIESPVMDLVE